MKKLLCLLLTAAVLLSVSACSGRNAPETSDAAAVIAGRDPDPLPETEIDDVPADAAGRAPDLSGLTDAQFDPETGRLAYYLALPDSTRDCSTPLAMQALLLCSGHTAENTAALLGAGGFELLAQENFDKAGTDPAHTCAYTVARKTVLYGGAPRTLLLTAVRGTSGGEWYSNFDIAPGQNEDSPFAENFLFAAEDALLTLKSFAEAETAPLFLICGHSRGAACANLLGVLVNELYGEENAFVYTFATPGTLRSDAVGTLPDGNIFNYLNPLDLVPQMPLEAWGYSRAGTNILLPADREMPYGETLDILAGIAPTVDAYYNERHSLTGPGLSEDGLAAFEVFLMVGSALAGAGTESDAASAAPDGLKKLLSTDSDLYPLTELLERAAANDWEIGKDILHQHLPDTYGSLLEMLAE